MEFCNSHLGHFGLLPRFSSMNDRVFCVSLLLTRFKVKSPESHLARSYVARNQSRVARNFNSSLPKFNHAQQHPNILIALVSFHQIFKNKIFYSFDVLEEIFYTLISLFSSLHRIKNGICCTFIPLVSSHHIIIAYRRRLNYTIITLVLSHYRLKNEIYYTHS